VSEGPVKRQESRLGAIKILSHLMAEKHGAMLGKNTKQKVAFDRCQVPVAEFPKQRREKGVEERNRGGGN